MIAEAFTTLLRDWNHWAFELVLIGIFDGLIGVVGVKLWHRWHKRHDARVHMVELDVLAALEDLTARVEQMDGALDEVLGRGPE